ncbi:MAG: clostripain-related cysteine peptidase [Bdellovibrionia bacterium]
MRRSLILSLILGISVISQLFSVAMASPVSQTEKPEMKEWTFLIYLNGNNNLDRFGTMNMNQMEKVGSTADINVVTQWASLNRGKVERLYVIQDNELHKVTSPVIENLGSIDMGDWHNLVDFIHWGVANYPAKHYFIDVWDHGSGWHSTHGKKPSPKDFKPFDISWDENTGNSITTLQLGEALEDAAKFIGHKIDFFASDACLMGMAEVAREVSDSVNVYGGSEEVEAAAGWPYDTFLARWTAHSQSTPAQVAEYLTEEYINSYSGGGNGYQDATFAAYDLSKLPVLTTALRNLSSELTKLPQQARARVVSVARDTQNFSFPDYGDLTDFVGLLEKENLVELGKSSLGNLKTVLDQFIITHGATSYYSRAAGLSIWLPTSKSSYDSYAERYSKLKFQTDTNWSSALRAILKSNQ